MNITRRHLIASAAAASASLALPHTTTAEDDQPAPIQPNATILFQGDSITDTGRAKNPKNQPPNNAAALGRGYAAILAGQLLATYPEHNLSIHNRGISGNKVPNLHQRWQTDTLDLQPDLISILIGVNDLWHKLHNRYQGTVADYHNGYRRLIQRTREALPETRIVLCEPFVLTTGAVNQDWFPEFTRRREAVAQLAAELNCTFVPFQSAFDAATKAAPPAFWAGDGVHPTQPGHALMAQTWRHSVGI